MALQNPTEDADTLESACEDFERFEEDAEEASADLESEFERRLRS